MRTLGVEEELLLVDPETRRATARSPSVLQRARTLADCSDVVEHELFRHQLEIRSAPVADGSELRHQLRGARRLAGRAGEDAGVAVLAAAVAPTASPDVVTTDEDRYRAMVEAFGDVARQGGTCGMHVHVSVESEDEGVRVVDALGPWLSPVLALSVNSPVAEGHDTGYASWRSRQWSQWPTAGPTAPFGTADAYHRAARDLVATGAARDTKMLYYDARLADEHPTVEVRVCDVQTDLDDSVVLALLVRALVSTAADGGLDSPRPARIELLRAGRWRAARDGLTSSLLDPVGHRPAPARDVVSALVERVTPALTRSGDLDVVGSGVERLLAGTGATRQRAALERTGSPEGVVDDLVERTRLSWT